MTALALPTTYATQRLGGALRFAPTIIVARALGVIARTPDSDKVEFDVVRACAQKLSRR